VAAARQVFTVPPVQRAANAETTPNGRRILIVDDDEIIAVALYRHLIGLGFSVDLAVDAGTATSFLSEHGYALIVLDAYLTGQLHARALHFIETVRASQRDAHILLLTAYGSAALARYVATIEHITLVRKPQSVPYLAELVEGFVARRSMS
jgi:ActR/RegA family two-component response regulator